MGNVVALATLEHVLLDVVADGEQVAARCVDSGVLAVGAGDALGDRGMCHKGGGESCQELLEGHCCEDVDEWKT